MKRNRFLFYLWGCFVTAYARRNLWRGIYECGNDYVYSDTDSIKIKNAYRHMDFIESYNKEIVEKIDSCLNYYKIDPERSRPKGKQMGIWDYDGHYTVFKTLGAKRYIYLDDEYDLHITVAGLAKVAGAEYLKEIGITNVRKISLVRGIQIKHQYEYIKGIFDSFTDNLKIPAGRTGKMTHSYIDYEMIETVEDYQGNVMTIHELSGVHLEDVEYRLSCEEFLRFLNKMKMLFNAVG